MNPRIAGSAAGGTRAWNKSEVVHLILAIAISLVTATLMRPASLRMRAEFVFLLGRHMASSSLRTPAARDCPLPWRCHPARRRSERCRCHASPGDDRRCRRLASRRASSANRRRASASPSRSTLPEVQDSDSASVDGRFRSCAAQITPIRSRQFPVLQRFHLPR